ncbi:MAG: DUF6690 family protein [Rubripirellula sp.]
MFPRLRTAAILAAAAGGPYVASETDLGRRAMTAFTGQDGNQVVYVETNGGPVVNAGYANHSHHEVEKLRRSSPERYRYDETLASKLGAIPAEPKAAPKLVGTRINDIREVLRFDISPRWVLSRFSRVSTVLADLELEGLRVPIVTGTRADDMAGTLTYYFDRGEKLQRVTVHGFTGDPTRLVGTMTQGYGLNHEPSLEAGVYTKRWNGRPTNFLRLTHAPVVYSDAVHQKYTVFLELNQPDLAYGISPEAQRIVESDRQTGRW